MLRPSSVLRPGSVAFSCRMTQSEHGEYKVLYNSQLLFQHRLYADLDAALYHVHLFQPLAQLIKHTELYVHNAVPQEALRALTRWVPQLPAGPAWARG